MNTKTSAIVLGAAIAGLIGAASVSTPVVAAEKAQMGLCKGVNSCSGKSACGEVKGTNGCKGQGFGMMSKAKCEKEHHEWMPAPKMEKAPS